MIIGIAGRKRSGKDSIAAALVKDHGFVRIAFADALKDFIAQVFGWSRENMDADAWRNGIVLRAANADPLTGQQLMQHIGNAGRQLFGENFWIERLNFSFFSCQGHNPQEKPPPRNYVISDVHFWNEVNVLRAWGGLLIRTNRVDRQLRHDWKDAAARCCYIIRADDAPPIYCNLPKASHPSHYSGDLCSSETTLPDSSSLYNFEIESSSGEEAAAKAIAALKEQEYV